MAPVLLSTITLISTLTPVAAEASVTAYCTTMREVDKAVPERTWTLVNFYQRDSLGCHGMKLQSGQIVPSLNGWANLATYLNFKNSKKYSRFCVRFARNPLTNLDSTGSTCFYGKGSNQYSHMWTFGLRINQPVGLQVWSEKKTILRTTQFKVVQ